MFVDIVILLPFSLCAIVLSCGLRLKSVMTLWRCVASISEVGFKAYAVESSCPGLGWVQMVMRA